MYNCAKFVELIVEKLQKIGKKTQKLINFAKYKHKECGKVDNLCGQLT